MNLKTLTILIFLLLSSQSIYAKKSSHTDFLLQANDETSFMHYEFHHLAYEAAEKKDFEDAYRIYSKLANKGDDRAEYNIGMMYMKGLGVERGKMDAYKWLRRASKHGNKEATLYFQKMNERYSKKVQEPRPRIQKEKVSEPATKPAVLEKNSSAFPKEEVKNKQDPLLIQSKTNTSNDSSGLLYIIIAFVCFMFILAFFFLKKSKKEENGTKTKTDVPQNSLVYKAQIYDITYSYVSDYHSALLKQVDMGKIRADKSKLQVYYMFIYGMIDYFCQLAKLADAEQRRIFSSHMGELEGKENITAITQVILEGQRDSSMYHYQAAGGVSAQAWHEHQSADALSMLKKVLTEKRH